MMGGYPGGYPGMGFDPRGFQGQPGGSPAAIQFQQQQMAQYQQQMAAAEHQARALAAAAQAQGMSPGQPPQPERGVPGFVDAATSAGAAQGGADAPPRRKARRRRPSSRRRAGPSGNPLADGRGRTYYYNTVTGAAVGETRRVSGATRGATRGARGARGEAANGSGSRRRARAPVARATSGSVYAIAPGVDGPGSKRPRGGFGVAGGRGCALV